MHRVRPKARRGAMARRLSLPALSRPSLCPAAHARRPAVLARFVQRKRKASPPRAPAESDARGRLAPWDGGMEVNYDIDIFRYEQGS